MISCFKGKFRVTSPRGVRTLGGVREYHGGLDLVAIDDNTVYAVADGTVDATPYEANGFGYYVRQKLPDGRRVYYGHMAKGSIVVTAGQAVNVGDKLGTMGSTGRSTGAHTHLELRPKGTGKDSLDIAAFTGIPNKTGTYEYKEDKGMKHFTDTVGHFAENAAEELCDMGIVSGSGDGTFSPDAAATRAEVAVMLRRAITYITGK